LQEQELLRCLNLLKERAELTYAMGFSESTELTSFSAKDVLDFDAKLRCVNNLFLFK
jgi:hypothetical protein